MKNVLVTGGAGFIGSNFIRFLLRREPQVRIANIDALTYAGSRENLTELPHPNRHVLIEGDICDSRLLDETFFNYAIDTVVHFAAETHVDRSILGPAPFIQTNVIGTFQLLEAAREHWSHGPDGAEQVRFHHISTDEVFGSLEVGEPSFHEATPYAPNSPYAASKAASDHLVRAYGRTYDLPITITNCSNNYGPYQFPEKLIPLAILNAISGESIPIYGDGGQIRDWLFVEDHCEAIWTVLKKGQLGETYLIGGGNQLTNLEVARLLCQVLDERLTQSPYRPHQDLITFVRDRPGHDRRYAIDTTKIKRELGWLPEETLESGLQKTVEWYLAHRGWVDSIRECPAYRDWLEKHYSLKGEGK
jgi:dTDP-glucose 4,6-dehydratase